MDGWMPLDPCPVTSRREINHGYILGERHSFNEETIGELASEDIELGLLSLEIAYHGTGWGPVYVSARYPTIGGKLLALFPCILWRT